MNLPVVRRLVETHSLDVIADAIAKFEADRSNPLDVQGEDDGEKLSNLLVSEFVLLRMKDGVNFNEAIREYSQRVRSMIKPKKK